MASQVETKEEKKVKQFIQNLKLPGMNDSRPNILKRKKKGCVEGILLPYKTFELFAQVFK